MKQSRNLAKSHRKCILLVCSLYILVLTSVATAELFFDPDRSYLSPTDSPFSGLDFRVFFELEDFEDGLFDDTPGLGINGQFFIPFPSSQTDSVDSDDGNVDGFGNSGRSLQSGASSISITFDDGVLGQYPTHAGLVWTDVGTSSPNNFLDDVQFEAFDPAGASLGILGPVTVGDGISQFGETDEDRFFGVSDLGGVSEITLTSFGSIDWEIDHIQFGVTVPEPNAYILFILLMFGIGASTKIYRNKIHTDHQP